MSTLGSATPHLDLGHKMLDFGSKLVNSVQNLAKQADAAQTAPQLPVFARETVTPSGMTDTPAQQPAPDQARMREFGGSGMEQKPGPDVAPIGKVPVPTGLQGAPETDTTDEDAQRLLLINEQNRQQMENAPRPMNWPSFDNGGDVDKDKVAVVHEGEKVLDPVDAEQYRQEHGENFGDAGFGEIATPGDERHDAEMHQPGEEGGGKTVERDPVPPAQPQPVTDAAMKPLPGSAPQLASGPVENVQPAPTKEEVAGLPAVSKEREQQTSELGNAAAADVQTKFGAQKQVLRDNLEKAVMSGDPVAIGKAKLAEIEFARMHPWGSLENHPGFMGKLAHTFGKIGSTALEMANPVAAALVPGNDMHRMMEENRAVSEMGKGAEAELHQAQAKAALNKQDKYDYKEVIDNRPGSPTQGKKVVAAVSKTDPNDVQYTPLQSAEKDAQLNQQYLEARQRRDSAQAKGDAAGVAAAEKEMAQLEDAANLTKADKSETAAAQKKGFEDVIAKVHSAGYKTDPQSLPASLDAALNAGKISQKEADDVAGYQAANPTPATNVIVSGLEAEQKDKLRDSHKFYQYTDENGDIQVDSGDKVPKDASGVVPIQDLKKFMNGAENLNVVQKSFDDLGKTNFSIFDNSTARAVLTTALDEGQAHSMGLLVAGTGGNITMPAGSGKIIDQLLENHAVPENLRNDVKKFIVDYYGAKDKLMALQMALQDDKIGRAALPMLQPMFAQMPGPASADSQMARYQMEKLQGFLDGVKDRYPNQYGHFAKSEPEWNQHSEVKSQQRAEANHSKAGETNEQHPAAPKSVDEFHGKRYLVHADGSAWENQNGKIVQVRQPNK